MTKRISPFNLINRPGRGTERSPIEKSPVRSQQPASPSDKARPGQRWWLVVLAFLLLAGCTVGPKYRPPPVAVPDVYRGLDPNAAPQSANSLGDEKWWTVFEDPRLRDLIHTALAQNYDVRIAATRVLEAQAALGITRADQFPTIGAGISASTERFPKTAITPEFETSPTALNLSLVWELDFWGKFRSATKAADRKSVV